MIKTGRTTILSMLLCCGLLSVSCRNGREEIPERLPVIYRILGDTAYPWYIDSSALPEKRDDLPIGVFGTSPDDIQVLETILGYDAFDNITGMPGADGIHDFAGEHFLFLYTPPPADSARTDMIRTMSGMFRWQDERPPVKALVVAGDRASVEAFDDIRDLIELGNLKIHTVSVLQSGIDKTIRVIRDHHGERHNRVTVGVLAPSETFAMKGYDCLKEDVAVVFQPFSSGSMPSLDNPEFMIDKDLIRAYHFNYRQSEMEYRGSRFNPSYMKAASVENAVRYAVTSMVEQLRNGSHPRLKYIVLGHNVLQNYKDVILESLVSLRNYRSDNRYVYRHIIDQEVILTDPQGQAAATLYQLLRENRLAAFRSTPSCVSVYTPEMIDLTKYPLLHVCINH